MFKRDKEIWNLQEKISRQKDYIDELETLKRHYKNTSEEQRETIDKQDTIIKSQKDLVNEIVKELYSNVKTDEQKVDKLKELVSDYQSLN